MDTPMLVQLTLDFEEHQTPVQVNQDDVLDCLERLRPMLMRMARNYHLDQDDVMQDAALIILETLPKIDVSRNPVPYLRVAVRRHVWLQAHSTPDTSSLHEPLSEDGLTLEDLLPAPVQLPDQRADKRVKATRTALRRLPLDEQLYMKSVHALDFAVNRRAEQRTRNRKAISASAYLHLRADKKLARSVWS